MTAPEQAARRADVLAVDDTPENLATISAVLRDRGYRVRAVPSGALALRAAAAEPPDVILLDVNMPQMDGYAVCRALKADARLAGVPVIFLSALSETLDKVKAFEAGGVDYVTKPFRAEEIAARLETHLAVRRLQLEVEARNAELQRSYARLQELERTRQALVQMIVHDLKNPLAALRATAGYLERTVPGGDAEVAEALADCVRLSEIMSRMVVDVLDVARTEAGALRPQLATVTLAQLLEEVAREARGLVREQGTRLTVTADPALPPVEADPEHLRRVLQNLLDNALKYAPGGSEIRLEALGAGPGRYRLRVCDEGPGVPAEERELIFEPYRRLARDAAQPARASRGLGLAFCRLAAQAHGGRVWVEPGVPKGSAFVVELPVTPPPPAPRE